MSLDDVRKNWDSLGAEDPLWAVLTDDRYRGGKWDEDAFFATGAEEIAGVVRDLDRLGKPERRGRCLDFGCGVGRLTQALAAHMNAIPKGEVVALLGSLNTSLGAEIVEITEDASSGREWRAYRYAVARGR